MDLATATSDEILRYHEGWRAARQGLSYETGPMDPWWLTGWADETRNLIAWLERVGGRMIANDNA